MQAQTSQQCVVVSFDTYCMNARGKINIYDIPILSFNISLDNPNLANLVSRHINTLICPTSIEHSASTYVVHGQRSVGGSPA